MAREQDTKEARERMDSLQQQIDQEREDRIQDIEDQLRPIKAHIEFLDKAIENEKIERVEAIRELSEKIDEDCFKLN